jgi:CubicO group peptidase (beta-lactamase class C family)
MRSHIALAATLALANAALAADSAQSETRIRRLQAGLVPPVLVRGEAPAMPTLAARMVELNVPGVSIAVIHDGHIEWARGFGVASEAGPQVTANTLFQAASISKPVFALGVLHLVDAGKVKLDTSVSEYLRSWKLPENEFTAKSPVTLRRLLSHSAGTTVHGFRATPRMRPCQRSCNCSTESPLRIPLPFESTLPPVHDTAIPAAAMRSRSR